MLYVIMVAFGPTKQVEASLKNFRLKNPMPPPDTKCVVVNGHYPIASEAIKYELPVICWKYGFELLDPGKDIGSAQSQTWCLEQVGAKDGDYWVNLDPDATCHEENWLATLLSTISSEPRLGILSLNSQMFWERAFRLGQVHFTSEYIGNQEILYPATPDMFGLSIWSVTHTLRMGGIPQLTPFWGNVESACYAYGKKLGFDIGVIYGLMETSEYKLLQDRVFIDWKFHHGISKNFLGSFAEYCAFRGVK